MYQLNFLELSKKYKDKAKMPLLKLFIFGIMAGAFIAIGAASSNAAIHGISNIGIAKSLAGIIFPVGLILIIFMGGELFTGDCLMIFGVFDKKYSIIKMLKVLAIVLFSNLVGSLLIVFLVYFSGQFYYSNGLLGAYTISMAAHKVNITFAEGLTSGILCNILVCAAMIMAAGTKSVVGKISLVVIPIFAFIIGGYEHCVANMYYVSAGILASTNPEYLQLAKDVFHVTNEELTNLNIVGFGIHNLIPVVLGNAIGGMVFVAVPLYVLFREKETVQKDPAIFKARKECSNL